MAAGLVVIALAVAAAMTALAQQPSTREVPPARRARVLVLGTYHMANPGRDIVNLKVDDVLAPKRQAEIAELLLVLKRFQPTKIAVEGGVGDDRIPKRYAEYLAGKHELTRNEIEQIGFRLARELGHETVYPVDVDGEFPYPRVVNFANASGRSQELDAITADVGTMVKALDQYLASHTVLETMLYVNADDEVAENVSFYYRYAHFGEPGDWAGADLVSDYFRRNMRIYSNLVQLVESPQEHVLVLYGYGHLGWLRHAFASDPSFELSQLADYVP